MIPNVNLFAAGLSLSQQLFGGGDDSKSKTEGSGDFTSLLDLAMGNGFDHSGDLSTAYMSDKAQAMADGKIAQKDQDGDGALSEEEFGISTDKFAQFDTNGDGLLSSDELIESQIYNHGAIADVVKSAAGGTDPNILAKDTDGDGVLSEEEMGVDSSIFSSIDTDGDGSLTSDELIAAYEARNTALNDFITANDADGNGGVNDDEIDVSSDQFTQMDRNGDGVLDINELAGASYLSGGYATTAAEITQTEVTIAA